MNLGRRFWAFIYVTFPKIVTVNLGFPRYLKRMRVYKDKILHVLWDTSQFKHEQIES